MCLLPPDRRIDKRPLTRALDLAEASAAFASPNPTVGCVLELDETVLGEGAHHYDTRDHAEIVALKAAAEAGHSLVGSTAFVTLEPCSHHGRTGPCADALIAAGIARCVVATVDPNPLVSGQGIARLQAAGVEVDLLDPTSPLAQRARRLNDAFAFSIQHGRPFITLKAAVSRDGNLAPSPERRLSRDPFWLTGPAARDNVQHLRHLSDAILTGIGTVLADDPSLTDRTGLPRRKPLLRVILDAHLRTPLGSKLVATAGDDLLILCTLDAAQQNELDLRAKGADIVRLPAGGNGQLDLNLVLSTLAAATVRSLLVEGGTTLNTELLAKGFVDKLITYTAPVELGPGAMPFAQDVSIPALQASLTGITHQAFPNGEAEDVRLAGYLHDPWGAIH